MSEYEQIIDEIVKHGVVISVNKIVDDNYINHERKYVGCVVKLDFTEHDKVFEDKIAELGKRIQELEIIDTIRHDEKRELKQRIAELESKKTEKPTKINLNDRVKVKLTPLGAEIYYHQYDELSKRIKENGGTGLEPRMPEIDKDGYTKFTLWEFMELYGEHMGVGKLSVIAPLYIELCQDEWKMRYNEEPIEKNKE